MTTLLIDADLLAYKAATATEFNMGVEVEGHDDEDLVVRVGSINEALEAATNDIRRIKQNLGGKRIILCFTSSTNFRKQLYPDYKANRTGQKPIVYAALKKRLGEMFEVFERPGLEADDVMGILGTHPTIVKGERIIVSEDKDMMQIDCPIYRRGDIDYPTERVNPAYIHMYQTLTGDQTDNYPGCPGIGPKTAEKILNCPPEEWWPRVLKAFNDANLDETFALTQARVAKILDHSLYNFKTKEPILWSPA
jgi:DNA polymerase I